MLKKLLLSIIPSRNDRLLGRWKKSVAKIGALEAGIASLSDEALRAKALALGPRIKARFEKEFGSNVRAFSAEDQTDHPDLHEAFALAREASKRCLGMRHFNVQLVGGMALHEGKLSEMRTGEGKTLVITLPSIYNALAGIPVHVVTVNEYLASRDAEKMRPLYAFFGLETGVLASGQDIEEKKSQYARSIVYGVNHEFGFDYLKENMVKSPSERRMGPMGFAVVDEVDSILIDEARTPLIIVAEDDDDLSVYPKMTALADEMKEGDDVEVDRKARQALLTERGFEKAEAFLCATGALEKGGHLYDPKGAHLMRALQACLQARFLYLRDQQYIVREGQAVIVDENTGRLMGDRRWSNGIHQAVEAKEGLEIRQESKTMASITYQNFFRLYPKLAGLTGTAMTQSSEFWQIYGLETVEIPTNKPMLRKDEGDIIYRTEAEKWEAVADEIAAAVGRSQPVLAGTGSVEDSEKLSAVLAVRGIAHEVLNAKNHALEASIIEQAGIPGRVTVATNMAGRGTDIVLGGNVEHLVAAAENEEERLAIKERWAGSRAQAVEAGGLYVVGSCRHESRRVDNQLRGRSGRQGDPGRSKFFISLEDEIFRHAQKGFLALIDRFQLMPPGTSLEHPMLSKALERAQRAVEGMHFNMRKNLIDYDDVSSEQRRAIYEWRNEILDQPVESFCSWFLSEAAENLCRAHFPPESMPEQWDGEGAAAAFEAEFGVEIPAAEWMEQGSETAVWELAKELVLSHWRTRRELLGEEKDERERGTLLSILDDFWREHLTAMATLLDGIHLRAYAQKDPKREFKREAFEMFGAMRAGIVSTAANALCRMRPRSLQ